MRFLHTSDWHLGQKFLHRDRTQEHELALNWLVQTIENQKIDCLIVAGDIFDIGNPPNYARRMYYRFLTRLLDTCCQHIIIIGGNHDSPAMLNAPKELLEALNMHVIGTTTGSLEDQIIELRDEKEQLKAVIAAIPFLRDKDLRSSISGETGKDRITAIRAGIRAHYVEIGAIIEAYKTQKVPLIAVGHLYVKGSYAAEERANIYIGDKENIEADQFPELFDYIALGHIHRAQAFKGHEKVQYSGSLIPLSFSETKDEKVVKIVDLKEEQFKVTDILIPQFRRLKTVKMEFEPMKTRLLKLHEDYQEELKVWVDAVVTDEKSIPNLDLELREFVRDLNVDLLKIRTTFQIKNRAAQATEIDLKDLQPMDVFLQKCDAEGYNEEEKTELISSFKELQSWMIEKEKME